MVDSQNGGVSFGTKNPVKNVGKKMLKKYILCECPHPYLKHCFGGDKKITCYLKWLKKRSKKNFVDAILNDIEKEKEETEK
ncbi:MAG TPA: hypothetical protein VEP90_25845 [Methylomirabilota bacterium]|nr:hypothetical protein [Methylomirabilota bacterium]